MQKELKFEIDLNRGTLEVSGEEETVQNFFMNRIQPLLAAKLMGGAQSDREFFPTIEAQPDQPEDNDVVQRIQAAGIEERWKQVLVFVFLTVEGSLDGEVSHDEIQDALRQLNGRGGANVTSQLDPLRYKMGYLETSRRKHVKLTKEGCAMARDILSGQQSGSFRELIKA